MRQRSLALAVASSATIAAAVLHTIGNIVPPAAGLDALAAVRALMQDTRLSLGLGMTASVWDIQRSLVFTMSICLLTMGGLGLLVALDRDAPRRLQSRVAAVSVAASGGLTMLFGIYGVAPPFLTLGVVTLLHVYAWRTLRRPT